MPPPALRLPSILVRSLWTSPRSIAELRVARRLAAVPACASVRRWNTSDASSRHAEYLKQLRELEEERTEVLGPDPPAENSLGDDRQRLFDFPPDEVDSWRRRDAPDAGPPPSAFTHLSSDSASSSSAPSARMVDVSPKSPSPLRSATARATLRFPPEIVAELAASPSGDEMSGPKGPIFSTARLAGIMAAKRTPDLIPLCHPLSLSCVDVDFRMEGPGVVVIECTASLVDGRTGVEMEALTGASVAALTVYDMCKAVSHRMDFKVELVRKAGGKGGTVELEEED